MHFLVPLILHAIVYGVIFHLLRYLSMPELVGLGLVAVVVMVVWSSSPLRRRAPRQRW